MLRLGAQPFPCVAAVAEREREQRESIERFELGPIGKREREEGRDFFYVRGSYKRCGDPAYHCMV